MMADTKKKLIRPLTFKQSMKRRAKLVETLGSQKSGSNMQMTTTLGLSPQRVLKKGNGN